MGNLPGKQTLSPHWIERTGILAILVLALAARWLPGPRTIDDSYITFRYARNILAGNGFTYNPGEHVLGTTTPLYAFLLTLIGSITGGTQAPFPVLALHLNALSDATTCLLLTKLGRRLGFPLAGLAAALVWAVAPYSVTFAVGGLETSLYVLLLVGTASAHLYQRHSLAALLGGLALLTRPDALILLGPLALDRGLTLLKPSLPRTLPGSKPAPRQKSRTIPQALEGLAFLLPVLSWIFFASLYFGSPLPHSIAAKSVAYRLPSTAALVRLIQHYATPFLENLTFGIPAIAIGFVLYPFLFLIGVLRSFKADRHSWPILAYPWLYFGAFAIANPLIFRWYMTPPLPFYILTILIGFETLLGSLFKSVSQHLPSSYESSLYTPASPLKAIRSSYLIVIFLVIPSALSLRGWDLHPDHGPDRPAPEMAWYKLELLYQEAAQEVSRRADSRPGANLLAAGDVGVLGFFTDTPILDTVGLNSPQSLSYYPLDPDLYTTNYAVPPGLILDLQPDFVVILEVYGREGLLKEQNFWQQYQLARKIPSDIYGSDGMLIFERLE